MTVCEMMTQAVQIAATPCLSKRNLLINSNKVVRKVKCVKGTAY